MQDPVFLALISAFFLGCYDLCKKVSVQGNAVIPVLMLATLTGAFIWAAPVLLVGLGYGGILPEPLRPALGDLQDHGMLLGKSCLVGSSWILSYFALKSLPVSIASPIRATSPLITLAGAVFLLGERPGGMEWVGVGVTLMAFWGFSIAGRKEGINFFANRAVFLALGGTVLGAVSALYDKFLFSQTDLDPATVQAWFSIYLALFLFPFWLGWFFRWWPRQRFEWRWSIPWVAILLLLADFVYFTALEQPEAMIAVITCLRRASMLMALLGGIILLREKNFRAKFPWACGILLGIVLIVLG